MDASTLPSARRLATVMKDFYWYCVSLVFGSSVGCGSGVNSGSSGSGRRHRFRPQPLQGVSVHSADGYQIISFLEAAPGAKGGSKRSFRISDVRSEQPQKQRLSARASAAAAPLATATWRLVNRKSKLVTESPRHPRDWDRDRDRRDRDRDRQKRRTPADVRALKARSQERSTAGGAGGSDVRPRRRRRIHQDAWLETAMAPKKADGNQ